MSHFARLRILNGLECPANVILIETTIAAFMEGRDGSVKMGLEMIADLTGQSVKSVQRALKLSESWQAQQGVRLRIRTPGERNVHRVTEFSANDLNVAGHWITTQVAKDSRPLALTIKIDELVPDAIKQFLRAPLASVKPQKPQQTSQTAKRQNGAESVVRSSVILSAIPAAVRDALARGYRVGPVNAATRKPFIWNFQQCATRNETVIRGWITRFDDCWWGTPTGRQQADGRYLMALDADDHAGKFGNGIQTLKLRESDLGPLPATYTVTTPHNGKHFYFSTMQPMLNSSGLLGPQLDVKGVGGFVIVAGCKGEAGAYTIIHDAPIAPLPEAWENALLVNFKSKRKIAVGERHDYLRGVAYAMACQGKQFAEIMRTVRQRMQFNCESGGRVIDESELVELASSAIAKVSRADEMLNLIVA